MAQRGKTPTIDEFPEQYQRLDIERGIKEVQLPILGRLGLQLHSTTGLVAARGRFEQLWVTILNHPERSRRPVEVVQGLNDYRISHLTVGLDMEAPDGTEVNIAAGRFSGRLVDGYLGSWSNGDQSGAFGVAFATDKNVLAAHSEGDPYGESGGFPPDIDELPPHESVGAFARASIIATSLGAVVDQTTSPAATDTQLTLWPPED